MVAPRRNVFAEESAEVEVLFANMDKLKGLTKKIQASMNRLETSGKSVQDAIGPIYGNTQKLQITNSNIDKILDAIERVREPLDQRNREERIIKSDPNKVGLNDYMASLDRTTQALGHLKDTNLRSNQQAVSELDTLLQAGTVQLQRIFKDTLMQEPVEPLQYVTKQIPFPTIPQDKLSRLRAINSHVGTAAAQTSQTNLQETPTVRSYVEIRGEYMAKCLRNLSAASLSMAKKTSTNAVYKQGTNGIGIYAQGMEGLYLAEYENICPIFGREEWARVFSSTCQSSFGDFAKTLRSLNSHVKENLVTDCFLAYEILELVSNLAIRIESKTGELKPAFNDSLKPIRETAKSSLPGLLDDMRSSVQSVSVLPTDGAPLPITSETMTRLQMMTAYLIPLTSVMASLGDGGWTRSNANASSNSIPTLRSFDVSPDGRELFSHYATDTIDLLMSTLDGRARLLLKSASVQGVFLSNNLAIVERMIRSSELEPLLGTAKQKVDMWRKKSSGMYTESWRVLFDTQYTSRQKRPESGNADSAALIKAMSSKEKEAIKEKFKNFNSGFDELVQRHKSYRMEPEVRRHLAREVQVLIEPLYGRFWERYHEIDKGKGKHVKFDKAQLSSVLTSLG